MRILKPLTLLMTVLIVLLGALFVLTLRAETQPKPTIHGTIRLGSWNIEHLGDPKARRGPGEGVQQKPEDLAHYIRYAKVDALAVQEISADSPAPPGFPAKFRTNA